MNKKEIKERIKEIKARLKDIEDTDYHDEYDDFLDDSVEGCFNFSASEILKNMDPIAYSIGYDVYIDSWISDLEYELEELESKIWSLRNLTNGAKPKKNI